MTASQLTYPSELAAYAAGFFAATDPAAAVTFKDAALRADTLSAELRQAEASAGYGPYLDDVQPTFMNDFTL